MVVLLFHPAVGIIGVIVAVDNNVEPKVLLITLTLVELLDPFVKLVGAVGNAAKVVLVTFVIFHPTEGVFVKRLDKVEPNDVLVFIQAVGWLKSYWLMEMNSCL